MRESQHTRIETAERDLRSPRVGMSDALDGLAAQNAVDHDADARTDGVFANGRREPRVSSPRQRGHHAAAEGFATRRRFRNRIYSMRAVAAIAVVVATCLALMMSALSATRTTTTQDGGFYHRETAGVDLIGQPDDDDASSRSDASKSAKSGEKSDDGSENEGADDGDGSGRVIVTTGDDDDASSKSEDASSADMPAQAFRESLKNENGEVTLTVTVDAPEGAFPNNTAMRISEVADKKVRDQVEAAIKADDSVDGKIKSMTAVDIVFLDEDGNEIEPAKKVEVKITSAEIRNIDNPVLVHVMDKDKAADKAKAEGGAPKEAEVVKKVDLVNETEVQADAGTEDTLKFDSDTFSPYVIVELEEITARVISADGVAYSITVSFGSDAGIPKGAQLRVEEILQDSQAPEGVADYDSLVAQSADAIGVQAATVSYARFFDINIVDAEGNEVQPAEGAAVNVDIRLADKADDADPQVVHFGETTEVLNAKSKGDTVSFETTGFSVYGIVEAPEPVEEGGWTRVKSVDQLVDPSIAANGFFVRHPNGFYFTDGITKIDSSRTGITKTGRASNPDAASGAVRYFFEKAGGADGKLYAYCKNGDDKKYVKQSTNSLSLVASKSDATAFTIGVHPTDATCFNVLGTGGYYWNMQRGDSGASFAAYTGASDTNARIQFLYFNQMEKDPYKLDGKTYGIAYHNDTATAATMTSDALTVDGIDRLAGKEMLMRPDVLDNDGILLVAENSDITEWTFEWRNENRYYATTKVGGATKYLTIDGRNVKLLDEPTESSLISVTSGTGTNSGKYRFKVGNYAIEPTISGTSVSNGFWATNKNNDTIWLNLVEKSTELDDDDFNLYSARKVSVSDTEKLKNGQDVVIYTRVWNDTSKRYEFYVVDHDGSLARCYDTGDGIEWIGSQVNTAEWTFTEYTDATSGEINHYYELQNVQYGNFIAPQVTDGQVMSKSEVGVNLNGRRYGENYTTIIAWDDANYAYAGLKVEDGKVVSCPLAEADDFYFAIVEPKSEEEVKPLTTVTTIDNDQYGITMKMIDYNNPIQSKDGKTVSDGTKGRDSGQTAVLGYDSDGLGLLTGSLDDTGYPTTVEAATGKSPVSLSNLYNGAVPVNHLFLQSIYNESGYFEYNSTQNFAHLNDDGTFTVYDQLAAIGEETRPTRTHGQFMPYNEISVETGYAKDKSGNYITNRTDVNAQELPDADPRKGEKLYSIPQASADYFFGMEMEASFTQTADGLDAWGHDIIFEFSGDDDFWLYVDGNLVLDLGGVHSALVGSVNFRTGQIKGRGGSTTTLRAMFEADYRARNPQATNDEVANYLNGIFKDGGTVFTDYSKHTMKVFYMERGAGASNLHMRFNLSAVKPGTFILNKKLSGTDSPSNGLIEFPYQVYYESTDDGKPHRIGDKNDAWLAKYVGTSNDVTYRDSYTVGGNTYNNVFLLKPGESAEVTLPDDAANQKYYVVECGVNPNVYDKVLVNGADTSAKPAENGRVNYETTEDTLENRQQVDFVNHVADGAMRTLSISKKLYDSDGKTVLTHSNDNTHGNDDTLFNFRVYLGTENADSANLPLAYLYPYLVKDVAGHYCRWNAKDQKFDSLSYTDYDGADGLKAYLGTLTSAQKEAIVFPTSPNGSISKIPAGYSVEMRDLVVDTQFKVEEREGEIPKGYTLRLADGYERVDVNPAVNYKTTPVSGTVKVGEDPAIQVSNQKGWGLTVNKVWTDKDFMESHDPIFFAVYVKDANGDLSADPVAGSVRRMEHPNTSIYYFFGNLQSGIPFENYVVREVTLKTEGDQEIAVDKNGVVSGYSSVAPIAEDGTLDIGGQPVGGTYADSGFEYIVSYDPGEQTTQNENVRVDTVTNSRPGIELYKTDWAGKALSGATFTLKDSEGKDVAAPSYTSKDNGLITIAYLNEGKYTLTETATPDGYVAPDFPMKITIGKDDAGKTTVSVSGLDERFYTISYDNPAMAATITIRNCTNSLQVKKVDAASENKDPLAGAHFALYREVTDTSGNPRKDYQAMKGYEDLVTDADGILDKVAINLGAGTYYLTETVAPSGGYELMTGDLRFTIGVNGKVTIGSEGHGSWLSSAYDPDAGTYAYTITIPNGKQKTVGVLKVSTGTNDSLAGASFDLYEAKDCDESGKPIEGKTRVTSLTIGQDGTQLIGLLPLGDYWLIETAAPAGYNMSDAPIKIMVADAEVKAVQKGTYLSVESSKSSSAADGVLWQITVSNSAGIELPNTGGPGTWLFAMLGVLAIAAGFALLRRGHRSNR